MPTYMKAWEIVGYSYQADTYHAVCVLHQIEGDRTPATIPSEVRLDQLARAAGINRQDEYSFDSGDFPKVIFASQVEGPEPCGFCGLDLLD